MNPQPESQPIPYGLWPSPISAADISQQISFNDVQWDTGGGLVWVEGRTERATLVLRQPDGAEIDLTGAQSVRGGVGYGGGEFTVRDGVVVYAEKDGRLYRRDLPASQQRVITPGFGKAAAPALSPDGQWVVYVHSYEERDVLGLVDAEGQRWPVQIAAGADFYMQPVWSPDGQRLAWVEWDHPNMPWDGARLRLAQIDPELGRLSQAETIAGAADVPVIQPEFSPDGHWLSYIVEDGEWEQLCLYDCAAHSRRVLVQGGTLSQPAWVQGRRSYAWSGSRQIAYTRIEDGFASLWQVEVDSGVSRRIDLGRLTWIEQVAGFTGDDRLAFIASAADQPDELLVWQDGQLRTVRSSRAATVSSEYYPEPQPVSWTVEEAGHSAIVHGLFYRPRNPCCNSTASGLPPAIVNVHHGPTSQRAASFNMERAYFTSRGYAWLDVNYRGSTGYGRSYRIALNGHWGDLDVLDAASAAQALAQQGLADAKRLALKGTSAGGYTVLNTLIRYPGLFRLGVVSYPVGDLFRMNLETHKFERYSNDTLVGVLPEAAEKYYARSPVFHAGQIQDPVALFQGSADPVVPPDQAEAIAQALRSAGTPHLFRLYEGEGHGFRKPETLEDYYRQIEHFLRQYI